MKKNIGIETNIQKLVDRVYDDTDNPYGENEYELIDYEHIDDLRERYCDFNVYTQILADNEINVGEERYMRMENV